MDAAENILKTAVACETLRKPYVLCGAAIWHTRSEMAKIRDPKQSPRQAFARGFWNGMAAPLTLFVHRQVQPPIEVEPIRLPHRGPGGALTDDWAKIGADFHHALKRYEQEPPAGSSS